MSQGEQPDSPPGDQTGAEPPAPVPVSDSVKAKRPRTPPSKVATSDSITTAQPATHTPATTDIGGGVTGVGIGALFALWASPQPDGLLKTSCLVVVPIVTTIVDRMARRIIRSTEEFIRDRRHRQRVDKMRATLTATLVNPHTSPEHKAKMKAELEELEKYDVRFQKYALQTPPH